MGTFETTFETNNFKKLSLSLCFVDMFLKELDKQEAMGHIAHLRNLGLYRNILPISNMHFISIFLGGHYIVLCQNAFM
jgi:hypothetical protein